MVDGGYTPAEIGAFFLADVSLIFDGWRETPSIRAMVAAYLGVKPQSLTKQDIRTPTIAELQAMFAPHV